LRQHPDAGPAGAATGDDLSVGIIYALLAAIVAEFLFGQTGLGAELVVAQANSNTAAVFGVLVVLAVLRAVLNGIVGAIGKRAVFWPAKP
jgi:NitT/TauT family transport system permease protein